jgi:DHA2 family lincomycin resistance protein-like MFS transporter
MFILVLPIAIGALALGAKLLQNVSTPRFAPLDVISVILSALAFGGIVYGLSALGEGATHEQAMPAWAPLAIGLVSMAIFVWRQLTLQKHDRALLDLRTFSYGNYTFSVVTMAVAMMALFGMIILLPIYLQSVLGINTLQTGLLLLPGSLLMGLLGPIVGRLYDKVGTRPLLVPGTVLVSFVLWGLTLVGTDTSVWLILAGHIIMCLGLAFVFTPLFTASLSSLPMPLYSHGSAILGSVQQVAGAAGVALFVAIMTLQSAALVAGGTAEIEALTAGIRSGFLCGAIISLFAIVAGFFVKKPPANPDAPMGGHH